MGFFLSWFVLRKWFTIAGASLAVAGLLGFLLFGLSRAVGASIALLGVLVMLGQIPLTVRRLRGITQPPDSN